MNIEPATLGQGHFSCPHCKADFNEILTSHEDVCRTHTSHHKEIMKCPVCEENFRVHREYREPMYSTWPEGLPV